MPPPSPLTKADSAVEAKRCLIREVIHRLASGNKTHSEMAEVHHVLSQRDTLVLSETYSSALDGNSNNSNNADESGGQALEDALAEVALRKHRSGTPDEWELRTEAWDAYDPAFSHQGGRAHQSAAERRPKPPQGGSRAYAPRPAAAHASFRRIRRDLTADSCVLAIAYRLLHAHCREELLCGESTEDSLKLKGGHMYEKGVKSESALARAVHLLTLGAFVWEDNSIDLDSGDWRDFGGGDSGSVFRHRSSPPDVRDWIEVALLRKPFAVMNLEWYSKEETALQLLKRIASKGGRRGGFLGGLDPSLCSGAQWLCDFAAKRHPDAALADEESRKTNANVSKDKMGAGRTTGEEELERKKNAAKERAMAAMKAQMAKFAANLCDDVESEEEDDLMKEDLQVRGSNGMSPLRGSMTPGFATPRRNQSDTEGTDAVGAMDISPAGNSASTTPGAASYRKTPPRTPQTPLTPGTPCTPVPATPRRTPLQKLGPRLLAERPRCIICGTNDDPMQLDDNEDGDDVCRKTRASSEWKANTALVEGGREKALAFCGYIQASTVLTGNANNEDTPSHVGVHVTLCGHAVHKSCCDAWQRDDRFAERLDGVRRREFRCPLCQRLSNCLVPFVDVGSDWVDEPTKDSIDEMKPKLEEDPMAIDGVNSQEGAAFESELSNDRNCGMLHHFLFSSKWWATRNDSNVLWDGQCTFTERSDGEDDVREPPSDALPMLPSTLSSSPARRSLRKIQSKFGKRELLNAWNYALRRRRTARVTRSSSSTPDRASSKNARATPLESESDGNNVADVLRRFMDQVCDVGQKADVRRIGEEALWKDFGEFRHYLSEKAAYNRVNRAAGKEMVDVSIMFRWL